MLKEADAHMIRDISWKDPLKKKKKGEKLQDYLPNTLLLLIQNT